MRSNWLIGPFVMARLEGSQGGPRPPRRKLWAWPCMGGCLSDFSSPPLPPLWIEEEQQRSVAQGEGGNLCPPVLGCTFAEAKRGEKQGGQAPLIQRVCLDPNVRTPFSPCPAVQKKLRRYLNQGARRGPPEPRGYRPLPRRDVAPVRLPAGAPGIPTSRKEAILPVQKLDAGFVQRATCPEGKKKIEYRDTTVTGFCLEVRASGGATYYLRYFDQSGRQRQFKIGGVNDVRFEKARKRAQELRSEAVLGGDPMAKKAERKAIPTYGELAAQHLAFAKSLKSYSSIETNMRVHILPRWRNVRLSEIRPQEVAAWLHEKDRAGLKPSTVEKIRVLFHRSFELAQRWNIPGAERNPAKGIPRPKFSNGRQRFLTSEEAQRLRWAVELSPNKQLKHIVGLLLLTGARVGELLKAEWKHVDLERRSWLIPVTKTGKSRNVPLSQAAIDILTQVPKLPGCPYVVPNLETGRPFVSIKKAWQTARDAADLPDLRIHDLRHSAASFLAAAGTDLLTIGKILGHADYRSTARYSHVSNTTLLNAVEAGASKLQVDWSATP